jgi:hypothetical protein
MTDLNSLVVEAFREKAVRSAMLVDESFPTLAELINYGLATVVTHEETAKSDREVDDEKTTVAIPKRSEIGSAPDSRLNEFLSRFREAELASQLYSAFHKQGILCDVANNESDWKGVLSARIADSDLVVLDLNLSGGSNDASESIAILRNLAKSRTFNLIVVYTKANSLQISAKMVCGGLRSKRSVENVELEIELPEIIKSLDDLEAPTDHLADCYLTGAVIDKNRVGKFMKNVFENHKSVASHKRDILEKVAEHVLQKDFAVEWNSVDVPVIAADLNATNPWLLCENFFLCFAQKYNQETDAGTKPIDLIPLVDGVIQSWNPGITRVILSQIRNTIGKRGLEFLSGIPHDIETQISWLWHSTLYEKNSQEEIEAIEALIKTLLVSFADQVTSDAYLTEFVRRSLDLIPRSAGQKQQLSEVSKPEWLGRECVTEVKENDVLHALNVFQSSKRFNGKHITTGTILRRSSKGTFPLWLACVEPACDTVPSQAPKSEEFLHCRMRELFTATDKVVCEAHKGNHLFVKCADGTREYLSLNTNRGLPKLYTSFVRKTNQIRIESNRSMVEVRFPRLCTEPSFDSADYEVVTQLHDAYANRLLHDTGHHLSRIGLDFVSLANVVEEEHGGTE